MLTMHELYHFMRQHNHVDDVMWANLTHQLIVKLFFAYPNRDFLITPHTLMETGEVLDMNVCMDSVFDCPCLQTPVKRNLFRLYATIVHLTLNIQLGLPEDTLSKYRAILCGHKSILAKASCSQTVNESLSAIYLVLFKDGIIHPSQDVSVLDTINII